jgi:two-component system, sensor histidine kinase LadS
MELHAFDNLRDRIQATALVHSILSKTGEESDVEMDLYFDKLKEALVRAHGFYDQADVICSAQGLILNEKQATACGLIVSELVTNSMLHAFQQESSQNQMGQISISIKSDERLLQLVVSDNGIGMSQEPTYESMGLSLVKSLVLDDLKGEIGQLRQNEPGTTFVIKFPYSAKRRTSGNG